MYRTIMAVAVLAFAPMPAGAVQPHMQPGEWEYTTTTRISGSVDMPAQSSSYTQCVTESDVENADAFMKDVDDCDVERREITADSAGFTLVCPGQQGMEMRMSMDMRLLGARVEGESVATMSMNGESMEMHTRIEGHRLGDC